MSIIGQNPGRIDGYEKVTGKAMYAGDLKVPGMVHGKVLRSPLPHARIRSIKCHNAASLPGVLALLSQENLPVANPYLGAYVKDQPFVAIDKVRYAGDIVAAVAATDEATADAALQLIEVDYEELSVISTIEDALKKSTPLVHENLQRGREPHYGSGASYIHHEHSNIGHHFRYARGDIAVGFSAADYVFEDTFYFPSAQHYPMEPSVSVARFEEGRITVWSSTQMPFPLRQSIVGVFGLEVDQVRVIVPHVGGGYGGSKGVLTGILAAVLSRLAQRPVRVAFSAEESFKTICQPRAKVKIKTGVKRDGSLIARQCEVYLNAGAYVNSTPSVTEKAGYRAHGPYRIPHVLTDAYAVYTNTIPAGAFRGFGGPQVAFAYESHLDIIAQAMRIDPVELRLQNLLDRGEEYAANDTPIDCDLKEGLKQTAEAIGWYKRERMLNGPDVKRGKGIACGVKDGGGTNKAANAMVRMLLDGSIVLCSGSVEIGQGVRTVFSQLVAEEFSVPIDRIRVAEPDTSYTPFDSATNASSATSVMGQAVQMAARDARAQFLSAAASVLKTEPSELALKGGMILNRENAFTFEDIMRVHMTEGGSEITGRGSFQFPRSNKVPLGSPVPFWEIGFGAAEVEIDMRTGQIKILNYVSLTDAGKMIHPIQCQGQDEGSVLFAIGQTLFEDLAYRDGQLINPNLVDYRLPKFGDVPLSLTTIILEQGGGPGPYGAKGMGEGGMLGVAPAVCNAVNHATGLRLKEVPLEAEKIWKRISA
jgi:CO/xanthine dehydrogenase Mo-binding subunit